MTRSRLAAFFAQVRSYWFFAAMLVFVTGYYWIPTTKSLNNVFYGLLLLPLVAGLFLISNRLEKLKAFASVHRYFFVFLILMLTLGLFSPFELSAYLKIVKRALYVVGFLIAIDLSMSRAESLGRSLLPYVLLFVSFTALYKLMLWPSSHDWNFRLEGRGVTENSVLLAVVYGAAGLLAFITFLKRQDTTSWLYLLAGIVCFGVVIMSQSRGPMLALAVALCLSLAVYRGNRALLSIIVLVVLGYLLIEQNPDNRLFNLAGFRIEIWKLTFAKILAAPVIGYGLQVSDEVILGDLHFHHPHSVYLSILVQGGVLGLTAFLAMIGAALFADMSDESLLPWRILMCFALVYMLFDGSRVFTHPEALWLVFWLPLGVLMSQTRPRIDWQKPG